MRAWEKKRRRRPPAGPRWMHRRWCRARAASSPGRVRRDTHNAQIGSLRVSGSSTLIGAEVSPTARQTAVGAPRCAELEPPPHRFASSLQLLFPAAHGCLMFCCDALRKTRYGCDATLTTRKSGVPILRGALVWAKPC
jgi:hypothetical protein